MRNPGATRLLAAVAMAISGSAAAETPQKSAPSGVLGVAPTYSDRALGKIPPGPLPNEAAIDRRIWVPGLDDGYVPQGLTFAAGWLYVGTYRSTDKAVGSGPCRIYRVDPETGRISAHLDLPSTCGHAGGLARSAPGKIWVADSRVIFEISLTGSSSATLGSVTREIPLTGAVKGSFAAGTADALWLGSYDRDKPGRLWRFSHARIGVTLSEADASLTLEIPIRAQGAAFDATGQLWITRSGATLGELVRLDPSTGKPIASYTLPDGVEDLSFDAEGRIWTMSEAGSRRWLGWSTYFPVMFRLHPARLR